MEREVIEASSVPIPAGVWPQTLTHGGVLFYRVRKIEQDGELVAVIYRSRDGLCEIEVLND